MQPVRILSVVWYRVLPARFGGQKGIAEFNAFLSEHLSLSCLCSADNDPSCAPYPVDARLPVGKWQVMNPVNWWKILSSIRKAGATHLIIEHCYYALAGILATRLYAIPWVLHAHNIEFLRFREMGKWWWPMLKWLETLACRHAALVLFKTEADKRYAVDHLGMHPARAMVVPFGISGLDRPARDEKIRAALDIRSRHGIAHDVRILFFSGTLDYEPNARAFRRLVTEIIPRLEMVLDVPFVVLVCGRLQDPAYSDLKRIRHPRLLYIGEVEDVRPYFLAADVFLNPVITGGGIKVKTIEALSYDIPVVSTEHGAIGVERSMTGERLRVSADDDTEHFCRLVAEAAHDVSEIPDAYYVHYQWRHLTRNVAEAIKKLSI